LIEKSRKTVCFRNKYTVDTGIEERYNAF